MMEALLKLLRCEFGIQPDGITHLEGYEDQTYLVKAGVDRFILKRQADSPALREYSIDSNPVK